MALSASRSVLLLVVLLLLTSCFEVARAGESCCKYKLQQQEPEWIDDLTATLPLEWQGQPQHIDDPNDTKPDDWDDEDDGDWAPVPILNPLYTWKPRQIPNPEYVPPPTYWEKLRVELLAAVPWVTLGVFITGMLSLIPLPMETMQWWMQAAAPHADESSRSSDWISALASRIVQLLSAALLGLATPLCSCGALPLCAALLKQGVPFSSTLAFLTASQSSGLDSAAVTYGLLGARAMLGRLGGAIALALAVGLVCPLDPKHVTSKRKAVSSSKNNSSGHASSLASAPSYSVVFSRVVSTCLETATEIYPTVLMGLVLSTAALHYLPSLTSMVAAPEDEGAAAAVVSTKDLWMRVLLLGSAIPLQFCEHTSVTLAAAIQKAGGSPGLAFAFLLSAPATNLPTILWMWSAGPRQAGSVPPLVYIVLSLMVLCGTALALSYFVDVSQLDLLAGESAGEMMQLPGWLADSSPYVAGSLLCAGWYQKHVLKTNTSTSGKKDHDSSCGTCCDPGVEKPKVE
jgi:uncharacterized membrane protein YraQ (UPF0718 family)